MFLFRVPDVAQLEQQKDIEGLIRASKYRSSAFVRKRAATALGRTMCGGRPSKEASANAINALVAMLQYEDDTARVAADILGQIGDDRAVEPLVARVRQGDREVRAAAMDALKRIGDARAIMPLIAVLRDQDQGESIRDGAAKALATIGFPAVKPLVATLLDDDDDLVCIGAAKALGKIGSTEAVEPLIDTLQDGTDQNWEVRTAAVEALGEIRDDRAVEPLLTALQDEIQKVRLAAVRALGMIGHSRAVKPLLHILEVGREDEREAAAEALGAIGDQRGVEPLKAVLKSKGGDLRTAAVKALGAIGDPESLEAVIASVSSGSPPEAVNALGMFRDVRAVDPLVSILLSSDFHAQAQRKAAGDALAKIGKAAVERLVDALKFALENSRHDIQLVAVEALGTAGDPRAVDVLVTALRREEPVLRRVTANALGKIRDDRSVAALVTALGDEDRIVRERAGHALATLEWRPTNANQRDLFAAATHEWEETMRAESVVVIHVVDDDRMAPDFNSVGVRLKSLKLKNTFDDTKGIQVVSLRSAVRRIMKMYQGGLDRHQRPNRDLYHLADFGDHVSCFSPSYGEIPSTGIDVYKITVPLQILGLTLSGKRRTKYMVVERRDRR
jgi:HEAT repeat protein